MLRKRYFGIFFCGTKQWKSLRCPRTPQGGGPTFGGQLLGPEWGKHWEKTPPGRHPLGLTPHTHTPSSPKPPNKKNSLVTSRKTGPSKCTVGVWRTVLRRYPKPPAKPSTKCPTVPSGKSKVGQDCVCVGGGPPHPPQNCTRKKSIHRSVQEPTSSAGCAGPRRSSMRGS